MDGGWSVWGEWGTCSTTCGAGQSVRGRSCNNPAPAHGGQDCDGDTTQATNCQVADCPGFLLYYFK